MPQDDDIDIKIVAAADLGHGNLGNIGPKSARESAFARELGNPEYAAPPADDSECMDDRNEGRKLQLAGNRAVSEAIADYLHPDRTPEPLARTLPRKVAELLSAGRIPHFHEGCAAIGVSADGSVLRFIGENMDALKPVVLDFLSRLVEADTYSDEDFDAMQEAAAERGNQAELFTAGPDELLELARQAGAPITSFAGGHNSVGRRIDTSENSYDNGAFMREHQGDDGTPIGALSVTLGLYKKQLQDDGYERAAIDQRLLGVSLYNIAVLKMAEAEDAPGVIVG